MERLLSLNKEEEEFHELYLSPYESRSFLSSTITSSSSSSSSRTNISSFFPSLSPPINHKFLLSHITSCPFYSILPYLHLKHLTSSISLVSCSFYYLSQFYLLHYSSSLSLNDHKAIMDPYKGVGEELLMKLMRTKNCVNLVYKVKKVVLNYNKFKVTKQFNVFLYCCFKGYYETLMFLIKNELYKKEAFDNDALRLAIGSGSVNIVKALLETPDTNIDPSANYNLPVIEAAERGNIEILKLLSKDKRVNHGDVNNQAIIDASKNGHLEVVKFLLSLDSVNPSDLRNKAIISASNFGHVEVIKELLKDTRVDPAAQNNKAIKLASRDNRVEAVKELLKDKRVNPASDHNEALFDSATNGHLEIVIELLKNRKVDPKDSNYRAIRSCMKKKKYKVAEVLLADERVDMSVMIEYAIQLLLKIKKSMLIRNRIENYFKNEKIKFKKKKSLFHKYPTLKKYVSLTKGTCIIQ